VNPQFSRFDKDRNLCQMHGPRPYRQMDLHSADYPDTSCQDCVLPFFIHHFHGWMKLEISIWNITCPEGYVILQLFSIFLKEKDRAIPVPLKYLWSRSEKPGTAPYWVTFSSLYRYIDGKYSMKDEDQKSISCLTLFWSFKDCNWVNYHLGCHDNHNPRQARIMVIICLSWFNCTLFARGTVDANLVGKVNISGRYLPCQVLCLSYRFWAYAWRFLRISGKPWSFGSWRSPFRRKVKSFTKHTNLDKSIPPNLTKY
jgi:hypothetical protein